MMSEEKTNIGRRRQMIAEAAYFRAERRGFAAGDPVKDWCEAEAEVDAQLRGLEEDHLVERIEEVVAAATKKLAALKRKAARLSVGARAQWQHDVDKLKALRDALRPKLAQLREEGEQAGDKLRTQAERIRAELTELVHRLGTNAKH